MSDYEPRHGRAGSDRFDEIGERLERERPVPSAHFRGELRRVVARRSSTPMPALRLRIATCLAAGTAMLAVATLGVTGVGPLAPHAPADSQQTASVVTR
jgi:hypothetical protein